MIFCFDIGFKYRITWKESPQHKRSHVFVGVFLGKNVDGSLAFSLRPAFGTSTIWPTQIGSFQEVPMKTRSGVVS